MDKKGVITIKILILIISILLVFSVLFTSLYKHSLFNHNIRNSKMIVDNNLSDYNTYLYVNYGLYGTNSKISGKFVHSIYTEEKHDIELFNPISDTRVLNKEIQEFMKLRVPVNIMDRILKKLDIIKKAGDTKKIIGLKQEVDIFLSDLSKAYNKRIDLSNRVNEISYELIDHIVSEIDFVKLKKDILFTRYDNLEIERKNLKFKIDAEHNLMKKLSLILEMDRLKHEIFETKTDIKNIIDRYKDVKKELENIRDINFKLVENLISFYKNSKKAKDTIDRVMPIIRGDKNAIEVVKTSVIEELSEIKEKLTEKDLYITYDIFGVKKYVQSKGVDMDDKFLSLVRAPYKNFSMIDDMLNHLEYSSAHSFMWKFPTIKKLYQYNYTTSYPVETPDNKYSSYYKSITSSTDDSYMPKNTYKYKHGNFIYSTSGNGSFWDVGRLRPAKEAIYLNEYIMSAFKSYCKKENTNSDYFDKSGRESFFKEGEIEYILMGGKYEFKNITKTVGAIYAVRTVMNTIHVYCDYEKMVLSETIGNSVAGFTGFGGIIVSNAIRIAWALGESAIDVKDLVNGKEVPFYKFTPDQWKLNLGLNYAKRESPEYIKLISFDYYDYLYFMLLTVNNETKLRRIANLIQLNVQDGGILLKDYFTEVRYGDYSRSYYE